MVQLSTGALNEAGFAAWLQLQNVHIVDDSLHEATDRAIEPPRLGQPLEQTGGRGVLRPRFGSSREILRPDYRRRLGNRRPRREESNPDVRYLDLSLWVDAERQVQALHEPRAEVLQEPVCG